jgi:phage-related minor tail protein
MLANRAFQSLMGAGGSGFFASIGKVLGFANDGALNGGRVQAFAAGGIVNGPTVFPMANGAGLMGEAGPEAIMPLARIGGKLGVQSEPQTIRVYVDDNGNFQAKVEQISAGVVGGAMRSQNRNLSSAIANQSARGQRP